MCYKFTFRCKAVTSLKGEHPRAKGKGLSPETFNPDLHRELPVLLWDFPRVHLPTRLQPADRGTSMTKCE